MMRIPLSIPDLRGKELENLEACVKTNWISSAGSFVTDFENAIAEYAGVAHGVALANGTCAIDLALRLAGIGAEHSVIVPDWTFVATANAVCHTGAEPHFADVSAETWSLDPALLETAIADAKKPVGAIVPVHPLGHPADMDPIREIAARHGIPVVEDAAGALGAKYKGKMVGGGSLAATISFNGNKLLTCGSGGMLLTDDAVFADRARRLSAQARSGPAYEYEEIGFNYRLSNVSAAIGLAQFERFEEMMSTRRHIAQRYRTAVEGMARLRFMPWHDWAEPNGWLSAVYCDSREHAGDLLDDLKNSGIDGGRFWEPLADQKPYRDFGRTLSGVSHALAGRVIALPSSSSLTDDDQDRVIAVLERWA